MSRLLLSFFLLLFTASYSMGAKAIEINEREYQIKAAFIANFIRYTRWQSFANRHFQVCSTNEKINDIFLNKLAKETWFNLTPHFKVVKKTTSLNCDVLFIDRFVAGQWLNILPSKNILIISETRGYASHTSHINFFFADNKLRFDINPLRLQLSELSINASLLRLARITSSQRTAL